jgi:hypothetical protein
MAFSAVWIALASLLYCFDIQKAKVGEGNTWVSLNLFHIYIMLGSLKDTFACPGRYMAFLAVWIVLALLLYCFNI